MAFAKTRRDAHYFGEPLLHQRSNSPVKAALGLLILIGASASAFAVENPSDQPSSTIEPAVLQGPGFTAQLVATASGSSTAPKATILVASSQSGAASSDLSLPPIPSATAPAANTNSPLLDGKLPSEELLPPVVDGCAGDDGKHEPVQPYGGGHPTDWSWGCGGSPYRTGPGMCDNWKVGCRWHVTVDGLVMTRDATDLNSLADRMFLNNIFMGGDGTAAGGGTVGAPDYEPFNHGPGGRITFTSQVSGCTGYDIQGVYEGINDWNASIVFPRTIINNTALPIPPLTNTVLPVAADPTAVPPIVGVPPGISTEPGGPFPQEFQQRSLHYRSDMNSAELNFLPGGDPSWRPFFGVRFIRFDDEINDSLNQETQVPLPGPRTDSISPLPVPPAAPILVNDPIGPTFETDRFNLFHLDNNLMGFQLGLLHDTVRLSERFAFEGFVNGGVYYNRIKYSHVTGIFTTQTFADNTRSTAVDDARIDQSNIVNNDARDLSEISYEAEASLTGVCRLNKCWALRAGYQVLWINHLHLADQAFLGDSESSSDLLFHGWHAGIECRR